MHGGLVNEQQEAGLSQCKTVRASAKLSSNKQVERLVVVVVANGRTSQSLGLGQSSMRGAI